MEAIFLGCTCVARSVILCCCCCVKSAGRTITEKDVAEEKRQPAVNLKSAGNSTPFDAIWWWLRCGRRRDAEQQLHLMMADHIVLVLASARRSNHHPSHSSYLSRRNWMASSSLPFVMSLSPKYRGSSSRRAVVIDYEYGALGLLTGTVAQGWEGANHTLRNQTKRHHHMQTMVPPSAHGKE